MEPTVYQKVPSCGGTWPKGARRPWAGGFYGWRPADGGRSGAPQPNASGPTTRACTQPASSRVFGSDAVNTTRQLFSSRGEGAGLGRPGAMVASLSIPWGNTKEEREGYHLVWPRDMVQSAGGLLAVVREVGPAVQPAGPEREAERRSGLRQRVQAEDRRDQERNR